MLTRSLQKSIGLAHIYDKVQEEWKDAHLLAPENADALEHSISLFAHSRTVSHTEPKVYYYYYYVEGEWRSSDYGCTSCTVTFSPTRVEVANCGDTRCYLFRPRTHQFMLCTHDHSVHSASEVERLKVPVRGHYFIMGANAIMVSRSFGHLTSRALGMTHAPYTRDLTSDVEAGDWMIVGTDGLCETISIAHISKLIRDGIHNSWTVDQVSHLILDAFAKQVKGHPFQKYDNMCLCCIAFE